MEWWFDMVNYGSSIKGRREKNQDSFLIFPPNMHTTFLAVADGIGGSVGGEIASNLVIDTAKKIITEKFSTAVDPNNLKEILNQIYCESRDAIVCKINENPNLFGMGTTLSCALIHKENYVWGNIGDSRVYSFSEGEFHQITKDHSFVEKFVLYEDELHSRDMMDNYSHIVTRSLSFEKDDFDIFPIEFPYQKLNTGEGILICSDGLLTTKNVNQNLIFSKYLMESESLSEFIDRLISNAYEAGSNDNITCISLWNDWNKRKTKSGIL